MVWSWEAEQDAGVVYLLPPRRPAAPEDESSACFAAKPGLARSFEDGPSSLRGDRWWATHTFDTAEEYDEEAARLGIDETGELSIVTFELGKFLSTSEHFRARTDLFPVRRRRRSVERGP